jgi:hypothetical protein
LPPTPRTNFPSLPYRDLTTRLETKKNTYKNDLEELEKGSDTSSFDQEEKTVLTSFEQENSEKEVFQTGETDMDIKERMEKARQAAQNRKLESDKLEKAKFVKRAARGLKSGTFEQVLAPMEEMTPQKIIVTLWFEQFGKTFPGVAKPSWRQVEFMNISKLIKQYDLEKVESMVKFMFGKWEFIKKKWFKGNASFPTLSMILKLHESILLESQAVDLAQKAIDARDQWMRDNPDSFSIPDSLSDSVAKAMEVMKKYE